MPDYCIHHVAVYLPDAARRGVELAADRPARGLGCKDRLLRDGPVQREEVEGGSRAGDPWERAVDVGARQ